MTATLPMAPAVRFHLSLNVSNLPRSVEFYRTLFGREAAKVRHDYAKFELDDPPLVLSLEPVPRGQGGALNHLGFRLPDSQTLVAMQERLERAGIRSQREGGVECCYARQTKFWVHDPDRTLWEMYVLEDDIDHRGSGQSPEAVLPPAEPDLPEPAVWEHRLGQPVPDSVPLADNSADEVRLRGSFNVPLDDATQRHLLREAKRVLRPGGRLFVHVLVGEEVVRSPKLPGPAAFVKYVPQEKEPLALLESEGFQGLHLEKFGASPCFHHDGVAMREMQLAARKPGGQGEGRRAVLYKGPFRQVADDAGTVYPRGERVWVEAGQAEQLRRGPLAEQFLFFETVG